MFENSTLIILFIFLAIAWTFQAYLTFRQAQNIQANYKDLFVKYSNLPDHCVLRGNAKSRFFGRGCILIAVINSDMEIVECRVMDGRSVFSKMKCNLILKGQNLKQYLPGNVSVDKKSSMVKALESAAKNALEYFEECDEAVADMVEI